MKSLRRVLFLTLAGAALGIGGSALALSTQTSAGSTVTVPEPATMLVVGFGLLGLAWVGRTNLIKK